MILFGGKGGSGKTTSAAATAIRIARLKGDKRILIVSCDPAHSLGDSFGFSVGDSITPVSGIPNLWAQEINAERIERDFREEYKDVITNIIERGTYFDKEDITHFTDLQLPGLDEVMAVIQIVNLFKEGKYDLIIIDTAPTGHTIKLLGAPAMMKKWLGIFDMMLAKHRYMARHFTGRYIKDKSDEFLKIMTADINNLQSMLRSDETEFIPVTVPESMAIYETERLIATLKKYSIPVKEVIINRIEERETKCRFCLSRIKEQKRELALIKEVFGSLNLVKVPLFPCEVRGIQQLIEFGDILGGKVYCPEKTTVSRIIPFEPLSEKKGKIKRFPYKKKIIYLFGGKGGVGKTVVASASALYIARENPDRRVLLFSTDPASSLSDSFDFKIGDRITKINGVENLYAVEINAKKIFDEFIKGYRERIEKAFGKFPGSGVDIQFDREVMRELINLSPPGLDEIMALVRFAEFIGKGSYGLYILDTAATGHLIRFLEMPELMLDWLKAIFKILIKYKEVVRLSESASGLIELSKNIRKVQEILVDPRRSEFIAITIPEAMGFLETERLISSLQRLNIQCRNIVINMVVPHTGCGFCECRRKFQKEAIREVKKESFRGLNIVEVPLFPHDIRGTDNLTELCKVIYQGENSA